MILAIIVYNITVQIVSFLRGFSSAAFLDRGNPPEDIEVLTMFAIRSISMSWHSVTNHVGMRVASQRAFEHLFSNGLISLSERVQKYP